MKKVRIQTRQKIYSGRIIDVRIERHFLPDRAPFDFEIVKHDEAAAVLPVRGEEVLLLKHYRAPLNDTLWEIPAGIIERGEKPAQCVRRELTEETGYKGKNFRSLGAIHTAPGFSDEIIHLFSCEVTSQVNTALEAAEVIEPVWMSFEKVQRWLQQNRLTDVKTLVALYRYFA